MFRKSVLASAFSLILLPNAAGALGLGGIRTQSALNEPFSGQIDLLDVMPDEMDTIRVLLASQEEFRKVGATRPHFLTRLKFQPQVSSNGQALIRVTSSEPVREPFLDFLIEVNWPKGRLVKEFTVLLDPPATSNRRPPKVQQPAIQSSPRRARRGGPPPRVEPAKPPASVDRSAFPLRHGPVEPGAGLWRIARGMAPAAGATVAQTAMALYRNNQGAFFRGDINKLKVDRILEISTAEELFALDTRAADREFKSALRGESVTATPLTDITAALQPDDRLEIAGRAQPTPIVRVPAEAPPQSIPSQPPPAQAATDEGMPDPGATGPDLGVIEEDLLLVREAGESTRQETQELRGRILELEGQLADIQRLLKLSNERFAALQQAGSEPLANPRIKPTDGPPAAAELPREEPRTREGVQPTAVPAPDIASPASMPSPTPEGTTKTADARAQPNPERPFWESIPHSPLALTLTPGLLLLFLGWKILSRRKSPEETFTAEDLTLAAAATEDTRTGGPLADQTPANAPTETSSLFDDTENLDARSAEADAASKADVYIDYGRYREAEALLEKEVERSPDRLDIKYKLAEAYHGTENVQRMETLMEQIRQNGGDRVNPEQWQRLGSMLEGLKSASTEEAYPVPGSEEAPATAGVESARWQEPTFPPPIPPGLVREPQPELKTDAQAQDFAGEPDITSAQQPQSDMQDLFSQDFELDLEDLNIGSGSLASPADEEPAGLSGSASDLELQLDDLESLKDTDLPSFSSHTPLPERASADVLSSVPIDIMVDSLDISPVAQDTQDSGIASARWEVEAGTWAEVATKIDLARAYLEMEDPDAARVILDEVAQEGNEAQQAEAKEMMAQMR